MIQGRAVLNYPWQVFQHGHSGWWWTDANSVISRKSYPTEEEAQAAMERYQVAREIETPRS